MATRPTKLRQVTPEPPQPPIDPRGKIRLTVDRILVRLPEDSERKSKGGLLIPARSLETVSR